MCLTSIEEVDVYGAFFIILGEAFLIKPLTIIDKQEAMESFAFHDKITSKAQKFCKSAASCTSFHWNHLNTPFYVLDWYSKRNALIKKPSHINHPR